MSTTDLQDLRDHLDLLRVVLQGRVASRRDPSQLFLLERQRQALESQIAERAATASSACSIFWERFSLDLNQRLVVLLLAGLAIDDDVRGCVHALGHVVDEGLPMSSIRSAIYGSGPSTEALRDLGPAGVLRRFGIVVPRGRGNLSGDSASWMLSSRSLEALHERRTDVPIDPQPKLVAADACVERARQALGATCAIVVVTGGPGIGRRSLLKAAMNERGHDAMAVDCRSLDPDVSKFCEQVRAIAFEARLYRRAPLFSNVDALEPDGRLLRLCSDMAPLFDGLILATCGVNRPAMKWDRPVITIEMGPPTSALRAQLWHSALGQGTEADAELLATQYPLAPALIHHAAEAAKARATGNALQPEDIYAGIRSVLDDRLGNFARRVTVTQTWDDIVLSADHTNSLVELMARIRQRRTVYERWGFAAKVGKGLGVSALFSGPPGTGKTMVAGLIAQDLGLELYQVDLSKIVSKWIGETEKNLAALFDAAEAGHAILLFDEADSLFGKRTDVKSSNDRNANLETNYLLQRLESFTGICLLTTNHDSHIDPAFQRRLSLHLRFELPEAEERADLWKAMLPAAAPVAANVDFTSLAKRYAMSGGYIRNAALRAAFLAADEGVEISAGHLDRAARVEYEGMGKIAA